MSGRGKGGKGGAKRHRKVLHDMDRRQRGLHRADATGDDAARVRAHGTPGDGVARPHADGSPGGCLSRAGQMVLFGGVVLLPTRICLRDPCGKVRRGTSSPLALQPHSYGGGAAWSARMAHLGGGAARSATARSCGSNSGSAPFLTSIE